jgi:hypothetical protein
MSAAPRFSARLRSATGQSLVEMAVVMPFMLLIALGVVEVSYFLLDQHVVTRIAREGSNLISRDVTLEDARNGLKSMSTRPVDLTNGSKVILTVLKRGATTGTANYDRIHVYAQHEYGTLGNTSKLTMRGGGSFGGPPNYEAANADNNAGLQVTNVPADLVGARGGMIYVTEVFTTHALITPFERFGFRLPTTLYSIAYF